MEQPSKCCTKCGELKLLSSFSRRQRSSDGLAYTCKACKNEYQRRQRAVQAPDARERVNAVRRQWRADNPDKVRAENAKRYVQTREQVLDRRKAERRERTPEQAAARAARQREYNALEHVRLRKAEWIAANREHFNALINAWKKRNYDRQRPARNRWIAANKDKVQEHGRRNSLQRVANAPDHYIRSLLTRGKDLGALIPPELIELKRIQLQLKRTLKETTS